MYFYFNRHSLPSLLRILERERERESRGGSRLLPPFWFMASTLVHGGLFDAV